MAKRKYCYAIVKKDNAALLLDCGRLPIYWNKKVATERCKDFKGYCVQPILLDKMEDIILNR